MKFKIFSKTIDDDTLLSEQQLALVEKESKEIMVRLRDAFKVRMRSAFWQTTRSVENDV